MVSATAKCGGAATIVNAIATGKGAAFGIDLETKVTVELKDTTSVTAVLQDPSEDPKLVELCVKKVLDQYNYEKGATITVESTIPIAKGLKSSSVVANAAVLATFGALTKKYGQIRMVRLDKKTQFQKLIIGEKAIEDKTVVSIGIEAAKEAGVTITGAMDDAAAAYFGGFVVTDNTEGRIHRKGETEDLDVVIFIPEEKSYTKDIDVARTKLLAREVDAIWDLALKGDLYTAMTLNGLAYSAALKQDSQIATAALEAGAIAAGLSGTGPAVAALTKKGPEKIIEAWKSLGLKGEVIRTKTNNEKAKVIA